MSGAAPAAGLGRDVAVVATMRRHRADIVPHRPATALVTAGPFALTRNPIDLGNALALAGAGLLFSNPWLPLGAVPAARAVTALAIVPEERHMAARFGEDQAACARRVPRWPGVEGRQAQGVPAVRHSMEAATAKITPAKRRVKAVWCGASAEAARRPARPPRTSPTL